jgi:hypothetical protein
MNRVTLAIGGAVVLAFVIGLYVVLSQAGDSAAPAGVPKNAERVRRDMPDGARRTPTERTAERPSAVLPVNAAAGDGSGVIVRDHRSGNPTPVPVPPVITRPSQHRITPQLSSEVSRMVRAAVAACAGDVPKEARGATPRFEGQITIAIKSGTATITTAALALRDVNGVAVDDLNQCVAQKSIGATTPAGDEPDIDGYLITLSLRLP